jgi:hypothetical protein
MRKFLFAFVIFSFCAVAQTGIYTWQDHLSFNYCNSVSKLGSHIYASNYNGLLKVESEEFSTRRKNKINGLSDVGIKLLRAHEPLGKMLVIYENCNIDILDENDNVSNYPDIKIKTFNGKKTVNEVFIYKQFAYLACGFGIVKFDVQKLEVTDTYIIGPAGTQLEVYQVTMNDSLIFAATPTGLYKANYKLAILNNFNNWKKVNELPSGPYSGVINVNGNILAAYSEFKGNSSITNKDTLFYLNNVNAWSKHPYIIETLIRKLGYVKGNNFTLFAEFGPQIYDDQAQIKTLYATSFNGQTNFPVDAVFHPQAGFGISYWFADIFKGLYQTYGPHPFYPQTGIKVNGTNRNLVSKIDVFEGTVAVAPSHPSETGGSSNLREGLNILKEKEWSYIKTNDLNNNEILDINSVLIDRKDKSKLYASSWFSGLLVYSNNTLIKNYNGSNSALEEVYPGTVRCSGLAMDKDGNVWMAVSDVKKYLSVLKKDGSIQSFNFDSPKFTRRILVDKNNFIWLLHEREQGITVFRNNGSQPQLNVNYKILSKNVGSGNLESNAVFSIAEDKDGKIWVGTAAGIRVFYNPSNIFSNSNFDAQPIKIIQDGNVELLLDKEVVTAICVDGANNKWVGTQSGGLYCFSPDGQKQLYHFTTDNSPIYSDYVIDVNYDERTGDVFIGTAAGMQSFRSLIVEGAEQYENVYAYPNPVKPAYQGSVFVKGLMDNSIVKITDESGNLTWETKSQGGQIEWPVKTLSGARVKSGVYIIYATTTTAEFRAVAKVMVVN